ncbi:MAG: hypothetical protein QY320_13705 [Gammaproteobacteria bacterium]|nr:MAG: hypothetical protein QY320_13705 [Gammaproteobacteria bacterium]
MKTTLLAITAALAALPAAGIAQVNPAFADLTEATEQARTIVHAERKMIVSQALALTPEESNAFWPVFDRYMAELKEIGNLRVKVITDYAASYDNLSDATAQQLIADGLKYQEKMVDLRKRYLKKFRKVLPETKLARFYQLEYKLDTISAFALARQIPLVPNKTAGPSLAPPAR